MTERDPLWDPSVDDAELRGLSGVLRPLRHTAPLGPLPSRKPARRWPIYAGATLLAAAIALVVWRPWRPSSSPPPQPVVACADEGVGFRFDATAGAPTCEGAALAGGWLPVGGALETGAADRARLTVADIGTVELAEGSRLGLVATSADQHRLALDRGKLHAKVTAPPRLFVVETPTATAIDLGCEYDLEVALDGSATLRVTKGVVELADGARLSVVPMGTGAVTRRGVGPGTPWALSASPELRAAIDRRDAGDAAALDDILRLIGPSDTVTLWNLLSRVGPDDRARVYDAIDAIVPIPEWVLRDDVTAGNAESIEHLRETLEGEWFGATWE